MKQGKKLTIRVDDQLHAAASHKLIDSSYDSFQSLFLALLREWSEGKRQPAPIPRPTQEPSEVQLLREILEAGTLDERAGIRHSLKALAEAVRSRENTKPLRKRA